MPRKPHQKTLDNATIGHAAAVLTERDAARYIGMSRDYLRAARAGRGSEGPDYVRAGSRAIRYRITALDAWLERNTVRGTQGRGGDEATR